MTIYLTVEPNCDYGGYEIVVAFSALVPLTSTWTLYREDDTGRTVVRGAQSVSVASTTVNSVIDYEAPIDSTVEYTVVVSSYGEEIVAVAPLMNTCSTTQYLRDLLDPDVAFTSDFCLGVIDSLESTVRSGVYSVLGRAAPIVVVDARDTDTGTLRFIAQTQAQLDSLRSIFARGTPMLLQIEQEYNLGKNGVLYFQPTKFSDKWLSSNAKLPYHVIEVSFTVVDAPSYTTVFYKLGIPFDVPVTSVPGYTVPSGALGGRSYCDGGVLQHWTTFDDLHDSGLTYAQVYYTVDSCAG